jgi:hypothetical protein
MIYNGSLTMRSDILSYTIRDATVGVGYRFFLQAINAVGNSPMSDPLTIVASVPPSEPINLNVTGSGAGSISLQWKPPLENRGGVLKGYYVYY